MQTCIANLMEEGVKSRERYGMLENAIGGQQLKLTKLYSEMNENKKTMDNKWTANEEQVSRIETCIENIPASRMHYVPTELINGAQLFQNLGKFDNSYRHMQPRPFVDQIRAVQELIPTSWLVWHFQLSSLLLGEPLMFFQSWVRDLKSLDDFLSQFLQQYWSKHKQLDALSEIISCTYDSRGEQSYTEFVANVMYRNSQLDESLADSSLASILFKKLPFPVCMTLAVSSISSCKELIEHLHCIQSITSEPSQVNYQAGNSNHSLQNNSNNFRKNYNNENHLANTGANAQSAKYAENTNRGQSFDNNYRNRFQYRNSKQYYKGAYYDNRDRLNRYNKQDVNFRKQDKHNQNHHRIDTSYTVACTIKTNQQQHADNQQPEQSHHHNNPPPKSNMHQDQPINNNLY
ncbi:probable serine/threonine-protein kinase clkA [Nilaparvata lugens]|uniref:probable serine/threonine-protein kinase clkA n=1 Tax=Nilaparvata lugens TaxID=108931 RepID=UPI00193E9D26|nr:probable serine/threonine-protein kinase clkA [Nilaparvata lugens]XP_039295998.1 probable serine/threonine-protein kinase clkA [Nilaparvata lugens]